MNKRKGSPNPSQAEKQRVYVRDNGQCILQLDDGCTGRSECTDHRAGRGSGGSRVLNHGANLIGACRHCNGAKENATDEARDELIRRGVRVIQDSTNEKTLARAKATPVIYPDGEEYILIDSSTRVLRKDWTPF